MKQGLILLIIFTFFKQSFAQIEKEGQPVLSAGTLQFLWQMDQQMNSKNQALQNYVYHQDSNGKLFVNSIVKVQSDFDEKKFQEIGVKIGAKANDIWTTKVPLESISEFSKLPGLLAIEMDQPMAPDLDSARRRTNVDLIHKGFGLSQAYSGKGVVIGIIDAGFDYTHPTLYDTAYNRYRVKRVWEQKGAGTPPSGFGYGAEYADSASILARSHDVTETTHGTHVAGIAGGSGFGGQGGNNRKYRGMAFGSDLVFTAIYPNASYWLNTGMTDMLDGIKYTFEYAASVGKPAVANLSWGCPLGPRDGTSLFSQAVDNLVGPGKIFVLSGGNNGQNKIHLKKTFTSVDTVVHTFMTLPSITPKQNQVDFWGEIGKTFSIQLSVYNGNTKLSTTGWLDPEGNTRLFKLSGSFDTCYFTITGVASEFNLKPHFLVQVLSKIPSTNRICFSVKASDGTVNLWQGIVVKTSGYYGTFTKYTYPWAVDGDALMTCGDLVSTKKAIAVAAYNSKVSFTNVSGSSLSYSGNQRGRIATFSSVGPTADGRTKPNIAGPGLALASALSSYDSSYFPTGSDYSSVVSKALLPQNNRTYSFGMAAGTSMSSPAVSGIVAILLQVNPDLTPELLMDLLAQTAIVDNFTGAIPAAGSNTWGMGKINAYGAIKKLLEPTGIKHFESEGRFLIFPNPSSNHFNIEYLGSEYESIHINVVDQLGRSVISKNWEVKEGSNIDRLECDGLAKGIYNVLLSNQLGFSSVRILVK